MGSPAELKIKQGEALARSMPEAIQQRFTDHLRRERDSLTPRGRRQRLLELGLSVKSSKRAQAPKKRRQRKR